jgi:uncharacterized protein (TIGR02246 family)
LEVFMARIILFSSLVVCGLAALAVRGQRKNTSADHEALKRIEELHRLDVRASKAQDFKTLLSLWTEDGILLEPGRAPVIGKEALEAYMEAEAKISKTYTITKYEQEWTEIRVIGDWAFEWGFFNGEAQPVTGGQPIKQKAKMLRILKRQEDGSWKCARAIYHDDPVEG